MLGDLVNAGERRAALAQVFGARVHVGSLGEGGVVVARPLADDGDRDARVLHECQGRVSGVVQGDPAQARTRSLEQPPELVGVPLGMDGIPSSSVTRYSPPWYQSSMASPAW